MLELVPKDQLLSEAAQLCELLILLRHEADAGILQQVGSVAALLLSILMLITFATALLGCCKMFSNLSSPDAQILGPQWRACCLLCRHCLIL